MELKKELLMESEKLRNWSDLLFKAVNRIEGLELDLDEAEEEVRRLRNLLEDDLK